MVKLVKQKLLHVQVSPAPRTPCEQHEDDKTLLKQCLLQRIRIELWVLINVLIPKVKNIEKALLPNKFSLYNITIKRMDSKNPYTVRDSKNNEL